MAPPNNVKPLSLDQAMAKANDFEKAQLLAEQKIQRIDQKTNTESRGALQAINKKIQDEEKKRDRRGVSEYKTYYYCGTQAQIYFDDILVDEIRDLSFQTITNRQPIYGYASKLFDTMATGNLIVQGQFTINFVEAGYLNIIATAMKESSLNLGGVSRFGERASVANTATTLTQSVTNGVNASAVVTNLSSKDQEIPIKTFQSNTEIQAYNQIRGMGNEEFRRMAKGQMLNKFGGNGNIAKPVRRFDRMAPFDIFAVFGDYTNEAADHTVRRIKNVYLTGQGQTIISNGEPIGESYSFFARDIR